MLLVRLVLVLLLLILILTLTIIDITVSLVIVDTSTWSGAAYTPSPAGNQLWWASYDDYVSTLINELPSAAYQYGYSTFRVFLHNMVYDADPAGLLGNIDRFLTIADMNDIDPGFVFFDDCWDDHGATIPDTCTPVKGRHNGCWKTSPQLIERTNITRFQSYVSDIVNRFAQDSRVKFWEIFNEPNSTPFTSQLRAAAYKWAMDQNPSQPVLSCWDDNPYTQLVDVHRYDANFPDWTNDVYSNQKKGAIVTEGGSRWYQGYDSDAGSVKVIMTWLEALRDASGRGVVPYVPGVILQWELNVGNSNTRWHWSTADNTAEPVIPWDAHMFPDQTPISYTEKGLIRRYNTGEDPFLFVQTFMPQSYNNTRDYYLNITDTNLSVLCQNKIANGLYEWTIWPGANSITTIYTHAIITDNIVTNGYAVSLNVNKKLLQLSRVTSAISHVLGSYDYSVLECGVVSNGWNMIRFYARNGNLSLWLNPMHPEAMSTQGIQPRMKLNDTQPLAAGNMAIQLETKGSFTALDYISASQLSPFVLHKRKGEPNPHMLCDEDETQTTERSNERNIATSRE